MKIPPNRLRQFQFSIALIGLGLLSLIFLLAPTKARMEYRDMVAKIFEEICVELK